MRGTVIAATPILVPCMALGGSGFSINNLQVNEGDGVNTVFTFTVTLGQCSTVCTVLGTPIVTGQDTATEGKDFTEVRFPVIFPSSPSPQNQPFNVTVHGDDIVELNETFFVNLSNLFASGRDVSISDSQGVGTILDDE